MTEKEFIKDEVREGFYVSAKRKRLWWMELELLEEFQRICQKYNLRYFAVGGTLLGVVRHGGFIPWDDDVDVAMMREDYDRFIAIARKELKSEYFLQIPDTDAGYYSGYMTLQKNQTTCMLAYWWEQGALWHQGVFIDIMPLDAVPDNRVFLKLHKYLVKKLNSIARSAMYDLDSDSIKNRERMRKYRAITTKLSPIRVAHWRDSMAQLCNRKNTKQIGQLTSAYKYYPKFIWDRQWFDKVEKLPFEHITINVPVGYKKILTNLYGDWEIPVKGSDYHGELIFDPEKDYREYFGKYNLFVEKVIKPLE